MTHHLELVLPEVAYVVRMLDGRIDTAGSVHVSGVSKAVFLAQTRQDLRARGMLNIIAHEASAEAHGTEVSAAQKKRSEATDVDNAPAADKKPRRLVKDEARAEGGVKWKIYKTYIEASCVSRVSMCVA